MADTTEKEASGNSTYQLDCDEERFSLYAAVPNLTQYDVIMLITVKVVTLLLGLIGNLPLLWIFTRSKKIRNEKVFQLTLAVVDLLALFTLLPYSVFQHFLPRVVAVYYLAFFCTIVVGHAYHFTITLFTVFRYIAVYRPFESKAIHCRWSPRVPFIVCVYSLSNAVLNVGLDLIEFYNRNVWISFAMLVLNFSQIFVSLCVIGHSLREDHLEAEDGSSQRERALGRADDQSSKAAYECRQSLPRCHLLQLFLLRHSNAGVFPDSQLEACISVFSQSRLQSLHLHSTQSLFPKKVCTIF